MERAGWAWVCVCLLQRHCMAFLINGKQVCKITTELVPKILLLARAASQHRTQGSQFFWTKSILFFYKAMIMKGGRSLRPIQTKSTKEKGGKFGKTHRKDSVCQEVLEAEGGEYFPRRGFSKSQGSLMLVKTGLDEQEWRPCAPLWRLSASWASFLTPAGRFQLLLLYHVFPEIRRLVKDNYAYDDHCEQDQGEEDHEEDIGGVWEGWGDWLFSWNLVGQVQHVAQSPPNAGAPDLQTVGKVLFLV